MATPVKVYGPPLSTAVSRVLACLLEKGVDYQLISVNMAKGEHKKPDYLKIQLDGTSFDVAVMNSSTVKDLKLAIRKKINEMEQSKMGHRHISWKHVWRKFCLSYGNEKLLDDNAAVQHFGIHNHSQVHFVPYTAPKDSRKHSKRTRHRFFHGLSKLS